MLNPSRPSEGRLECRVKHGLGSGGRDGPGAPLTERNACGAVERDVPCDLALAADLGGREERASGRDALDDPLDERAAAPLPEVGNDLARRAGPALGREPVRKRVPPPEQDAL